MNKDFMSDIRKDFKERFYYDKIKNGCNPLKDFISGNEENIKKIHAEAKTPQPLMIDEVAFAFIAALRVTNWETLGDEFGGYKIGRVLAYVLSVLNEKIEESTAETIRVDAPLYEQCPTVIFKEGK